MSFLKLRLSMIGTLGFIIAVSTLFFTVILNLIGAFDIVSLILMVLAFNVLQWLIAPYLIDTLYRVREASSSESPNCAVWWKI